MIIMLTLLFIMAFIALVGVCFCFWMAFVGWKDAKQFFQCGGTKTKYAYYLGMGGMVLFCAECGKRKRIVCEVVK